MKIFVSARLCAFVLFAFVLQLLPGAALAESAASVARSGPNSDEGYENRAAEFVMRRYPGERLMPVRIIGGVQRPGTYYLPENTDLITAISLSGGLATNADSENIRLNKWATQKYETLDLADVMANPKVHNPALGANDVLLVEEKSPLISNNMILLLSALSAVAGIAVGAVYISRGK